MVDTVKKKFNEWNEEVELGALQSTGARICLNPRKGILFAALKTLFLYTFIKVIEIHMVPNLMVQKRVIKNSNPFHHSSTPSSIRKKKFFFTLKIGFLFYSDYVNNIYSL